MYIFEKYIEMREEVHYKFINNNLETFDRMQFMPFVYTFVMNVFSLLYLNSLSRWRHFFNNLMVFVNGQVLTKATEVSIGGKEIFHS